MTDWNLATGVSQPLNRTGVENVQVTGSDVQGTLVGIDTSPSPNELVAADADSGVQINAIGALFPEEVINLSTIPSGNYLQNVEEQLVQENKKLTGDRATVIFTGVEMVNDDDDTSFTPGEPVYLDVGGGFTQAKPSGSGELVQVVGLAVDPANEERESGSNTEDRILLDVDFDYETLA